MASLAYRYAEKRVNVVDELIEQWKLDHDDVQFAGDVDELVVQTIELRGSIDRLVAILGYEAHPDHWSDQIELAHLVGFLVQRVIKLIDDHQLLVAQVQKLGYVVSRLNSLEDFASHLRSIETRLWSAWQLPNVRTIQASMKDIKEGNCILLSEVSLAR